MRSEINDVVRSRAAAQHFRHPVGALVLSRQKMEQHFCLYVVLLFVVPGKVSGLSEAEQGHSVLLVKPGHCAPSRQYFNCSQAPPSECILDVDCDAEKKCCFTGCSMLCARPASSQVSGKVCEVPIDLAFLIDSSESMGEKNFRKTKKMMQKVLNLFTISDRKTRVGAVMIDSVPEVVLNFSSLTGDALNARNVAEILERIQFDGGQTRIDLALRTAYKELFSKATGSRRQARKILLVFTDGGQTEYNLFNLTAVAAPLKGMGVHIFPVALWEQELNLHSLHDIASDSRHVFNEEFFGELLGALKNMAKVRCTGQVMNKAQRDLFRALLKKKMP